MNFIIWIIFTYYAYWIAFATHSFIFNVPNWTSSRIGCYCLFFILPIMVFFVFYNNPDKEIIENALDVYVLVTCPINLLFLLESKILAFRIGVVLSVLAAIGSFLIS